MPDGLACPSDRRGIEYVDVGRTGLYISVKTNHPGFGVYFLRYKDSNGVTRHIKLGDTDTITLEAAREKAKKLKAEITLGADPRAESNAQKVIPTLSEFFEEQYMPHARQHKRTAGKDEEYYRLRLKGAFGRTRLNALKKRNLQLFHSKLRDEELAPATCNHYLKLLKRVLNLAIQWEVIEGPNPAVGIQHYRELNEVENYLDDMQLQTFLEVLRTDKNRTVCDIILLLMSTGARCGEALSARWDLIDMERRTWRIPMTSSKSGKVRAVPLNDSALDVLLRQETKNDFENVFINMRRKRPYVTITKVFDRLRRKAGIPFFRIHDCRHFYLSQLVSNGRTLYEAQVIAGHANPKTTMRYSAVSTKALQEASAVAADVIKEAMKKTG